MEENSLTSTNGSGTVGTATERRVDVDATAKILTERLRELERQRWEIDMELQAIQKALEVAGVRPDLDWTVRAEEPRYAKDQTFYKKTLPEACETILKDHLGAWMTKAQIEYLVVRGGYKFETKDSKNSVGVTLQRLGGDGRIATKRARGSGGNQYSWLPEKKQE